MNLVMPFVSLDINLFLSEANLDYLYNRAVHIGYKLKSLKSTGTYITDHSILTRLRSPIRIRQLHCGVHIGKAEKP